MACSFSPSPDSFASELLGYLDCQAVTLGSQGYLALASPGSSVSLLLGAMLAILIGLIGYRLVFGDSVTVRDGVLTATKIGLVLAFASSWPAYRTVIFDVVLHAPAELAADIGRPAGLPGASGGLATRMDGVDRGFRVLAIYGVGVPTREQVEQANGVAPPLFANFDVFALGASRLVFLVGSLGAFALLRLSAGLLLALGPLFVVFLLFSGTRGLTEGWLRALIAVTIGSCAVAVATGIELALLEPWLSDLVVRRARGFAIPGVPTTMLATATIFALATGALLALVIRIAFNGSAMFSSLPSASAISERREKAGDTRVLATSGAPAVPAEGRSRATAVADSIAVMQRREEQGNAVGVSRADVLGGSVVRADAVTGTGGAAPLGQSFRRRTVLRGSGSAVARDRRL